MNGLGVPSSIEGSLTEYREGTVEEGMERDLVSLELEVWISCAVGLRSGGAAVEV